MCASDPQRGAASDDVWDDDSDHEASGGRAGSPVPNTQLDREWEARKQQFYNTGFRQGVEEGKEVTLQQGFNAGFAEGSQAGYEFGLLKSMLQVLAAHLAEDDSRLSKVQELLQQVSGLSNRTVMVDTCKALLAQQPADAVAEHLEKALNLSADEPVHSSEHPDDSSSSITATPGASQPAGASSGSPAGQTAELPLPLQLVRHLREELQKLGFAVRTAPPLSVASGSPQQQEDQE